MTNKTFIGRAGIGGRQALLLSAIVVTAQLLAVDVQAQDVHAQDHAGHSHGAQTSLPAKLVEMVRTATLPFIDVNAATAANYQAFPGMREAAPIRAPWAFTM